MPRRFPAEAKRITCPGGHGGQVYTDYRLICLRDDGGDISDCFLTIRVAERSHSRSDASGF